MGTDGELVTMGNLGKATVKVLLTGGNLTGLTDPSTSKGKEGFDFNVASDWNQVADSHECPPRNIEIIQDSNFAVMHPAKRFGQLNNRMSWLSSAGGLGAATEIVWNQLSCKRSVFNCCPHLQNLIQTTTTATTTGVDNDMDAPPSDGAYSANYTGPEWRVNFVTKEFLSQADDQAPLSGTTLDPTASSAPTTTDSTPVSPAVPTGGVSDDYSAVIEQRRVFDGVWWGVETDPNFATNLPFYLRVRRSEPKTKEGQPACVIVRLNPPKADDNATAFTKSPSATGQSFDLVFENGKTPRLYDWAVNGNPAGKDSSGNPVFTPFQTDLSSFGITPTSGSMAIGFLPVCGKLAIYLNGQLFLYNRSVPTDVLNASGDTTTTANTAQSQAKAGDFAYAPFTTQFNVVQVYGTNSQATVEMAAMRFAIGLAELPFTGRTAADGSASLSWGTKIYQVPQSNVAATKANSNGDANTAYTANGASFNGVNTADNVDPVLSSINYVGYGTVLTMLGPQPTVGTVDQKSRMYQILLYPQKIKFISTATESLPIGPPFVQRLRGSNKIKPPTDELDTPVIPAQVSFDASDDVISINENWSSPDRVITVHTMEITLYNDQGQYDVLLQKCYGIQVSMGWNTATSGDGTLNSNNIPLVFTGATYGGSSVVKAGREAVVVQCQDYMAVLESAQMINSPYYDGMDVFDAVKDLCDRALVECQDDTDNHPRYYLPSGYSWTQPKMRFAGQSTIKDNLNEMIKLCERVAYFDENGVLHLANMQGGLLSTFTSVTSGEDQPPYYYFCRNPNGNSQLGKYSDFHIILNERKIDYKLASTVNEVLLRTVDRLQGSVYLIHRTSPPSGSSIARFPYKKQLWVDEPALGSVAAGNYYADELINRFTKVPKGISFTTLLAPGFSLHPMDVIKILNGDNNDGASGVLMRVQTLSRNYEAEANSLDTSITCEWWDDAVDS